VQTDYAGVPEQTCSNLPFGDGLACSDSLATPTENHFTGKERDSESGLDYFGARYYGSNMGRFMSPDWSAKVAPVPYAKLDDPQSLNLYSYVRNNPLSRVDADGHVDWGIQRAWNWLQGKGFKTDAQIQGLSVAQTAHSNLGSTDWAVSPGGVSGHQLFRPGSDKCNEYVGDTLNQSGHQAPMVPDGKGGERLATAHELADPNVHISGLSDTKPLSAAAPGDVIAQAHGDTEGHTGIIVAPGVTSSANANQGGVVTENNWGFRDPNAAVNNGERNGSNSPAPVVRTPIDQPQ
jgi:RHS repeat-associated protein